MIKLYTIKACYSCNKAREWLNTNDIKFEEVDMEDNITFEELLKILSLTECGTDEIISKKSKTYQYLDLDFENLSLHELVEIISKEPRILRRPLISDSKQLQVGYNEDDIRKFLPRIVRRIELNEATKKFNK